MEKINLKICMGTMCYVLGGAELKDAVDELPQEVQDIINVYYSPCLGFCHSMQEPPFIELNGKRIAGVNKTSLLQILKQEIRNVIR